LLETVGVDGIYDLKTRKMGDMVIVDMHLEVDATMSIELGLNIAVEARTRVLQRHRGLNLMAHIDPNHKEDFDHEPQLLKVMATALPSGLTESVVNMTVSKSQQRRFLHGIWPWYLFA
jgi:hypothetical protein